MSAAPETKYTDRDVRESPELVQRAVHWVENYTGDFEYLIDMKMRVASGYPLTTPMIRGILNCMRHDPRITDLPKPLEPDAFPVEGTVVPILKKNRQRPRRVDRQCEKTDGHYGHAWKAEESDVEYTHYCEGIEYAINREPFYLDATVKVPFVLSKSGVYIHRVAPDGHSLYWEPERHGIGYWRQPELVVNLVCKYPSVLRDPSLLPDDKAAEILSVGMVAPCPHCG